MNGLIFDIQRFSVHDGPGIRTTFFLKGCPLRCGWCHNPEGLEGHIQLQYREESCIHCGECKAVCPARCHFLENGRHTVDFSRCNACGACTDVCPSGALSLMGQEVSPETVLRAAQRDVPFYGAEGGVTFSGGEASRQPEFLTQCLSLCRNAGLHTAVDTCGLMEKTTLETLAELCDLFLYDIKAITPALHQQGTGADNARILENYRILLERGCRVWVRVPVIGGFNASEEEMSRIAAFLQANPGAEQIELMPYHRLGIGKYSQIGFSTPEDSLRQVSHRQMQRIYEIFQHAGLPVQGAESK